MRINLLLTLALSASPLAAQKQSPDQLLQDGLAAQQANDLPTAIRDFRALVQLRPRSYEARVDLGAALALHQEYDAAIQQFEAADPLAPKRERTNVLFDLGLAFLQKGDLPAARQNFQSALDAQPRNTEAATNLADTDLRLNDPAAALVVLEPRATLAEQDLPFAHIYGLALLRSGQFHRGAIILERYAQSTDSADAYLLAGSCLLQVNEPEQARRDLESAHRLNPELAGADTLLGIARERTKDPFAAERAFRDALQLNPDDLDANLSLAALLAQQKKAADAQPLLDHVRRLHPQAAIALYQSGVAHASSGQPELAIADFKQALATDPRWLEPHQQLASLYDQLHQPVAAAAERAAARPPTRPVTE
jgi:tetratricopeptide (TPR) repeat protein